MLDAHGTSLPTATCGREMTMAFNLRNRSFPKELEFTPAAHAGVPVWNGPIDEFHPMQIVADAPTMSEHSDTSMPETAFATLGD